MTDLLSPEDTGEIVDLGDTVRFDVDATQAIQPYDPYAPTQLLRMYVEGVQPVLFEAQPEPIELVPFGEDLDTPWDDVVDGAPVAFTPKPSGPSAPPKPQAPKPRHALNERYGEYPIVRPHMTPGRRRGRRSRGRWVVYGVLTGVGGLLLVEAALVLGAWLVLR